MELTLSVNLSLISLTDTMPADRVERSDDCMPLPPSPSGIYAICTGAKLFLWPERLETRSGCWDDLRAPGGKSPYVRYRTVFAQVDA
jgi:hypothetical protein